MFAEVFLLLLLLCNKYILFFQSEKKVNHFLINKILCFNLEKSSKE